MKDRAELQRGLLTHSRRRQCHLDTAGGAAELHHFSSTDQ